MTLRPTLLACCCMRSRTDASSSATSPVAAGALTSASATSASTPRVFPNYEVGLEQEPGSSGRESAENTIRNLPGFMVYVDKVTGSKEVRANPFAAMVQNDQVVLIAGFWVQDFLHECEAWPNSQYKDQVDAAAGAFNRLAQRKKFDYTYSWVG